MDDSKVPVESNNQTLSDATDPKASSVHVVAGDAQIIITGAALDRAEGIDYNGHAIAASNAAVIANRPALFSAEVDVDTEEGGFANDLIALGWIPRGRTNRPSAPKPDGEPKPIRSQVR